jgi:hypothetical protein
MDAANSTNDALTGERLDVNGDGPSGVDRRAFMMRSALVGAMALTAKEMNAKYKETPEGGLAVSLVLC